MNEEKRITLTIGDWTFDHLDYDQANDVLYASLGEPQRGYGEETPEGHVLRFNENGEFCGITMFGVGASTDAIMMVTVPERPRQHTTKLPKSDIDRVLEPA